MNKRKDGRYQLRETLTINGVKKQYTFYGYTQEEVKAKRNELIRSNDPEQFTFKDVYNRYKKSYQYLIDSLDPGFRTKCCRIEAFGSLSDVGLNDITPQMVAQDLSIIAAKNPYTNKPTGKRTLSRYLRALSSVFDFAQANRWTQYNPTHFIKAPSDAPQSEREALTEYEYNSIIKITDERALAAKMMILLGLRRGELTALTWADVDFNFRQVRVNKSYDYKNRRLKDPKSKAGFRYIPLPNLLISELKIASSNKVGSDLVICRDGRMLTENDWRELNRYIEHISGVTFTWHQLRHTYATILYDSGTGVLEAQKFLGHADVKVTLGIYTHLSELKKKVASSKIDDFLAG